MSTARYLADYDIPEADIQEVRRLFSEGHRLSVIERCVGVSITAIERLTADISPAVRKKPLSAEQRAHLLQGWGLGR